MEIVRRAASMREISRNAMKNGRAVGLVPTMGALHAGHMSLVRRTRELSDVLVVSVFVNPTQFESDADLEHYPRDLTRDVDQCIAEGVDYVFAPDVADLYPDGASTFVEVDGLSDVFEGASRPGHFRGVATVVTKLFELVRPQVAAFGQKDAQQALVVRRLVRDLLLDVEVLVLPTVRDEDGVALSSRNSRLSATERETARSIPAALEAAAERVAGGERDAARVTAAARAVLDAQAGLEIDYVELVEPNTLAPVERLAGSEVWLLLAVRIGGIRLLDNARMLR